MFFKSAPSSALLATASILLAPCAHAQAVYYTAGHGDLGVEYTPGETEFEAHWHLGAGAVVDGSPLPDEDEYEPDAVIAQLFGTSTVSNSSVAAALNVSTGTTVFRTGITAYPPNVGFGLEEVGSPTDWLDGTITLTLTGFSGPGEVALSQTVSDLGTFVWFSSVGDSVTVNDNSWGLAVGGHQHLDWFFTDTGFYELSLTWSGTYLGGESPLGVSGAGTFGFQVGAVPEPASAATLAGFASLGFVALRRKRRA